MSPKVILYNAVSADGRIDWFTADIGLFYSLAGTWREDATLAGSETILAAQPASSENEDEFIQPDPAPLDTRPLLVVADSRGRVKSWSAFHKAGFWRQMLVFCSRWTPKEYLDSLEKKRIPYIIAGDEKVDFKQALEKLECRYGVKTIRVDSGGTLNGVLLREGLVDEVSLLIHPALVGGTSPKSMFRAEDLTSPEGVISLELTSVDQLPSGIVWLRYNVVKLCHDVSRGEPDCEKNTATII